MTSKLALVIHFHQPVGNLDAVVRNATDRCYRPFLEVLDRHPDIPMTLHYSGCLLEWLEENASDVTDTIRALSERGQVELMTGGFYEPILAALPRQDQEGQIRMLTDHLARGYGADATGLWLTERVWEQDVLGAVTSAGVRYTVVDDTIFHSVGITDEELTGPFVTDHEGRPLLVYAGDRSLRYLIPYKRVGRILSHLASRSDDRLFVYADDGEKFGEWPDTFQRVYEKGWLESFFSTLEDGDVELVTLGAHAATAKPRGRVYLPSSSYDEMMTWALPTEARLKVGDLRRRLQRRDPKGTLPFVRGAPWRAFLAKYPEVNQLQKRMLHVSRSVHAAGAPDEAIAELYRAQCNCAYWHGAFGGVYLAFMRAALWHHLMRAEGLVRASERNDAEITDVDADVRDEVLLFASWGAAVVSPHEGAVVELDDWPTGANLLAVTARHREAYHVGSEGEADESAEDGEMAASGAHIDVDPSSLVFDELKLGGVIDMIDGTRLSATFEWELTGSELSVVAEERGLRIEKRFEATDEGLLCHRRIVATSSRGFRGTFGSETAALPLNLGRDTGRDELVVKDHGWALMQPEGEVALEVTIAPGGHVGAEPIVTSSTSLEGMQTMFQGTIVTTTWDVALDEGEVFEIREILHAATQRDNLAKKERGVSA
jgi:4-alpha-glucanotransferase